MHVVHGISREHFILRFLQNAHDTLARLRVRLRGCFCGAAGPLPLALFCGMSMVYQRFDTASVQLAGQTRSAYADIAQGEQVHQSNLSVRRMPL